MELKAVVGLGSQIRDFVAQSGCNPIFVVFLSRGGRSKLEEIRTIGVGAMVEDVEGF